MVSRSYQTLQNQISQLQKKAQKILATESKNKNSAISRVLKLMKKLGVSISDLQEKKTIAPATGKTKRTQISAKGSRKPVAPKYHDSATGATWSGRGKVPRWLVAREAEGRSREEFKIPLAT